MRENEIQDVLAEALAAGGMARGTSALSRNIAVRARAASKRAEDAAQGAQEGAEAARDEARAAREQAEREAAEARRLADDAQRSAASAGANAMEAQEAARQAQAGAVAANSSATQAAKDAIEAREKADAADAKAAEAAENSAGAAEEAAQAKADAAKAAQDVSGLAQSLSSVSSQVGDMVDVQARMQADIQTTAAGLASHASSITSIQAAAGEAQEKARAAQDAAEAASGDASQALAMVGQASGAAASAQQAADKAKEDAAQAQAAADRAQADLSDAQDALAAVEAKAGANAADIARAQQAVASAKASADAAQAVADAAKSSAATAQASADGAKADAEAAQKSADDAQASADAAQASADLLATRVTKCETAITQNAEAIGLMATKEEMTQRLSGYPTAAQMEAAVKVQADRIDLAVGRIDSVSSIRQVERNRADTMAQLRNYAAEGHRDTWTTWKSYAGVSPGDTVQLKCDCSDTGKPVYILMTVESVTPTSATCVSHGMVDPNAELAARAYTDAKVKVESDRITAEVTERGKLGTKVATLEQTASGLQSQVTSVKGTADAAKAYADNKGMFKETVDLSAASWDAGTYYPVVGTRIPYSGYHDFQVNVQLNSGTKPPWSTHAQGFTCNLSARMKAGGWGTVNYGTLGWIDDSSFNYCDGMPAYIAQNTNASKPVLYLRGGGRYFVYCSYSCAWEPKPSAWTESEQTYAPTATPSNSSALVSNWAQRDAVVQHASKITQLESSISAEVSARTALGTRVSTLEQTADGLSSQVTGVTTRLDNLKVGGRNLFKGSGREAITLSTYQSVGSFSQFYDCLTFDPAEYVGESFTVSFWARSPNGTTPLKVYNRNSNPRYFRFEATLDPSLGTEWRRYSHTFVNLDFGESFPICNRLEIYASAKTGVQVREIKVERGTVATDWTPAPEDAEEAYATKAAVTELSTRVDQTNSSITDSIARKTTEISALQGALSGLSGDLGSVSGRVSEVEASFRRTMDASGNPQLDLMTTANGFGTRITNTEMAFMDSGQKVAYVSNKRLYIEQAEVVGQMQVGDYAFVQRPGHLSLKYVGA